MRSLSPLSVLIVATVLPAQEPAPKVDFEKQVAPILRRSCLECHGPEEPEADLDLSRRQGLFHDDEDWWVVRPGKPDESVFLERVLLPADDPDVMPAEGPTLDEREIGLLRRWIAEGAVWPDRVVIEEERAPRASRLPDLPEIDEEQRAAEDRLLRTLQERGAVARRITLDHRAVEVNLGLLGREIGDGDVAGLRTLKDSLVWLDLTGTGITDAALGTVGELRHLRRLHLGRTPVGDEGATHLASLAELRYLNLYATRVGDEGLGSLSSAKRLRKLYLWQTRVTDEGVAALEEALPELDVDRGAYLPPPRPPQGPPCNETCPVKGGAVDPLFTTGHGERIVAFCCARCRATFEQDPSRFAGRLPPAKEDNGR